MKIKWTIGLLILFLFLPKTFASQQENVENVNMLQSLSFKTTIIVNNEEVEWEFQNPDEYEWEKGQTVVKGEKARKEVEQLFDNLNIHQEAKVEDMVEVIKSEGYQQIKKLDVRWINENGELFTWVWKK